MKHFVDLKSISSRDLREIIFDAISMKSFRSGNFSGTNDETQILRDVVVALIFQKPSTRTRFSFEVGIRQMGGTSISVSGAEMQINNGEEICDTAQVLSRYVDMIVIRATDEKIVSELALYSNVPVINGLTNLSHPCQIMADIMTYEEERGSITGKKVVWFGDGNNVCQSFLDASRKFYFDFVYCGPEKLQPKGTASDKKVNCHIEVDPKKAVEGADLVVTDTWISMHEKVEVSQHKQRLLQPYQINLDLLKNAHPEVLFMHCMPIYRGNEVTVSVVEKFKKTILNQAENRLHVQKAIMKWCLL